MRSQKPKTEKQAISIPRGDDGVDVPAGSMVGTDEAGVPAKIEPRRAPRPTMTDEEAQARAEARGLLPPPPPPPAEPMRTEFEEQYELNPDPLDPDFHYCEVPSTDPMNMGGRSPVYGYKERGYEVVKTKPGEQAITTNVRMRIPKKVFEEREAERVRQQNLATQPQSVQHGDVNYEVKRKNAMSLAAAAADLPDE